jgi:hypothetical protein
MRLHKLECELAELYSSPIKPKAILFPNLKALLASITDPKHPNLIYITEFHANLR